MDAHERAIELFGTPQPDIPEVALDYVVHVSKRLGICGEVFIECFTHYAQAVEDLPCDDPHYQITPLIKRWFECRCFPYRFNPTIRLA